MEINQRIILISIVLVVFQTSINCMERPSQGSGNIPSLSNIAVPHVAKQALKIYTEEGKDKAIEFLNRLNRDSYFPIVKWLINELVMTDVENDDSIDLIILIIKNYRNADFYNDVINITNEKYDEIQAKITNLLIPLSEELQLKLNDDQNALDIFRSIAKRELMKI